MTANSLLNEAKALGFENSAPDGELFFITLNRALRQIFSERPKIKTVRIAVKEAIPAFYINCYEHKADSDEGFNIFGRCFSFKVSGNGSFTVSDDTSIFEEHFNSPLTTFKGFINKGAKITFSGPFSYTVYDLASYEGVLSDSEEDIPVYDERRSINLCEYIGDFMSIAKMPKDKYGKALQDASVSGSILTLPNDFSGEVFITYKSLPKTVSEDNADKPIEIDPECEHLLPLLISSYIWLDDDAERSQYYMSLYRDGMDRVRRFSSNSTENCFDDVIGWV